MGPGIIPETPVGKHNLPCHLQVPIKTLSCKKEAIYEHVPEVPLCSVDQGSFKMNCFKVEKCFMVRQVKILTFLLEITDAVSSKLKRRETFQSVISVQFKSQHLWWYGGAEVYGQLAFCVRHYECWKVYKGFRATYNPLQATSISGKYLVYFSRTL